MLKAGIRSEQVKTIFFTHLHADHDLGLAAVMANDFFWLELAGAAAPINIYGPPQTEELVDSAFRFISVGFRPFAAEDPAAYRKAGGGFVSPFITHEFNRDGLVFQDDRVRVTAVGNSHYALMPAQERSRFESYSYRIETPHGVIVFTGDTGPSEGVAQLAKGADVLIAEATVRDPEDLDQFVKSMAARMHWTPARTKAFRDHFLFEHLDTGRIGQLAAKAHVKSVLLYHYVPENKADQAAYVTGVKKYFSDPVFAPDDLDTYCMSLGTVAPCAKQPSRSSD
jgi:ribonuclease BN (tRNA processing enzyme)